MVDGISHTVEAAPPGLQVCRFAYRWIYADARMSRLMRIFFRSVLTFKECFSITYISYSRLNLASCIFNYFDKLKIRLVRTYT